LGAVVLSVLVASWVLVCWFKALNNMRPTAKPTQLAVDKSKTKPTEEVQAEPVQAETPEPVQVQAAPPVKVEAKPPPKRVTPPGDIILTNRSVTIEDLQCRTYTNLDLLKVNLDGLVWRDNEGMGQISLTNLDREFLADLGIYEDRIAGALARAQKMAAYNPGYILPAAPVPTPAEALFTYYTRYGIDPYEKGLLGLFSDPLRNITTTANVGPGGVPRPSSYTPYIAEELYGPLANSYGEVNKKGDAKTEYVSGYYRSDGTYVKGYYRAAAR
jgi:hypothetical protein